IHRFILFDNFDPASRPCTIARQPCRRRLRSFGPRILHGVREEGGKPLSSTSSKLQGRVRPVPDRLSILRPATSRYKGACHPEPPELRSSGGRSRDQVLKR